MLSQADKQIDEAKELIRKAAKILRILPDEYGWEDISTNYQDKYLESSVILTKMERDL